ncbi:hypothetical protein [Eikenella halliae]
MYTERKQAACGWANERGRLPHRFSGSLQWNRLPENLKGSNR